MFEFLKRLFFSKRPEVDIGFSRLVTACFGDGSKAERLIKYEFGRMPSITREEAIRRAVERLEDDRR